MENEFAKLIHVSYSGVSGQVVAMLFGCNIMMITCIDSNAATCEVECESDAVAKEMLLSGTAGEIGKQASRFFAKSMVEFEQREAHKFKQYDLEGRKLNNQSEIN